MDMKGTKCMQINRGKDVNFSKSLDVKEEFITLKDGESVKVRVLGAEDYISYDCHNDFNLGIFPNPCSGSDCIYCKASTAPGFDKLRTNQRVVFAFAEMSSSKVKLFDCSVGQARNIAVQIGEYEGSIGDVSFNLRRTGKGKDTTYNLNPILKMDKKEQGVFDSFEGQEVTTEFFLERLQAKASSKAFCVKLLMDKGFPVLEYFGEELVNEAKAIGKDKDVKPTPTTNNLNDLV